MVTIASSNCLELTEILLNAGFRLTLRPHFQTRWQTPEAIDRIVRVYAGHPNFALVEQLGESDSLFDSHVMITDWSGAGHDYALGLEKPVLYIDLPPKSRNTKWPELGIEPFESWVRDKIGVLLPPARLAEAPQAIRRLIGNSQQFRRHIAALRQEWMYNLGHSAQAGADAVAAIAAEKR